MASDAMGNGPLPGGAGAAQPEQQAQGQQLIVNAQYIKDLSFENPRAPHSLRPQTTQPQVEINVDVRAQNLGPDTFEVVLTIKVERQDTGRGAVPGRTGLCRRSSRCATCRRKC